MGRTIPSFRIASVLEEKKWRSFPNSLDKSDRKIFDKMLSCLSALTQVAEANKQKIKGLELALRSVKSVSDDIGNEELSQSAVTV
jgi:hypothetical protein